MEALGVVAADDHGESVLEAEGFGDFEVETVGVALLDAMVDVVGVGAGGFVEDGGEGGAGVFDVKVEIAGEEGFVAEEGAAEVGFAVDVDASAGFDVLGEEFGEDDLLGEEFGADGEVGLALAAAGKNRETEREERDNAETQRKRSEEGHSKKERKEFNTEFTKSGAPFEAQGKQRAQRRERVR